MSGVSGVARRQVVATFAFAWLLAACSNGATVSPSSAVSSAPPSAPSSGSSGEPSAAAVTVPLTVFGAASLKGALDQMKTAWEAANAGSILTISTDSSSALETQIEQGAPADLLLSADTANPEKLKDRGLADGPVVDFASNVLTVIVPAANPGGISSPADLGRSGLKIIAAGDDVPITKYANQVVANLAKLPGYPSDFEAAYQANVASKEDNVKAVVAKIELGEGDAGIVYQTDANASKKATSVAVPDQANVPATYAGVVVKASANVRAAHAFLDWVAGPSGQAILASFGFLQPPS